MKPLRFDRGVQERTRRRSSSSTCTAPSVHLSCTGPACARVGGVRARHARVLGCWAVTLPSSWSRATPAGSHSRMSPSLCSHIVLIRFVTYGTVVVIPLLNVATTLSCSTMKLVSPAPNGTGRRTSVPSFHRRVLNPSSSRGLMLNSARRGPGATPTAPATDLVPLYSPMSSTVAHISLCEISSCLVQLHARTPPTVHQFVPGKIVYLHLVHRMHFPYRDFDR